MSSRSYLPTLVRITKALCRYVTRYRATIEEHLTPEGKQALGVLSAACEAFLLVVDVVGEP